MIRDNKLRELPEQLCECKALRELNIQSNEITLLPTTLGPTACTNGWAAQRAVPAPDRATHALPGRAEGAAHPQGS